MRIDLLATNDPPQVNTTATTAAQLRSMWRVGAIMEAVAVRDVTSGELFLKVGDQRLPARLASGHSNGPLEGEHLQLRVLRTHPVLALETIEETAGADIAADALLRYLPRQSSPTPLLANLAWLARNERHRDALPPPIRNAVLKLWQQLPEASNLASADELQHALQSSGTFLEAQLAQGSGVLTLADDLKAMLLVLQQQLRQFRGGTRPQADMQQPPPQGQLPQLQGKLLPMSTGPASLAMLDSSGAQLNELLQQTEGTLARVTTHQLLNASAAQEGQMVWVVEVPVRRDDRADLLRFKFERESRQAPGRESRWSVELAMDLGVSGALHVHIAMTGERLNIQLRSESAALVQALNAELPQLETTLREQGLDVEHLLCRHGSPVDDSHSRHSRLLDLRA